MPTMYEIYNAHADRYDELVRAEDYQGNLGRFLDDCLDLRGARVMEAGVGTGRMTRLYMDRVDSAVCCDRSPHMLEFAERTLVDSTNEPPRLRFIQADNLDLPLLQAPVDIFLEGWSSGHAVTDCSDLAAVRDTTWVLMDNARKNLSPGGSIVFLETLGTNLDDPAIPHAHLAHFYEELEKTHRFQRHEIRTDYRFPSNAEATRVMGFFFGSEMEASVRARGTAVIPEWTGAWIRRDGHDAPAASRF